MLTISQKMSQQQKLTPQQIQFQKLLQLNTINLEQRIKTELELNPLLEEELDLKEIEDKESIETENYDDDDEKEDFSDEDNEFTIEDYFNDEEYYREAYYANNNPNDEQTTLPVASSPQSLTDYLLEQLYVLHIDESLIILGEEIIGNLDADGYLKQSLEKIIEEVNLFYSFNISFEEGEALLREIQRFDPIGIASRNLKECLLTQLENSTFDPYYSYLAEFMLKEFFDDFINKKFDALIEKMKVTNDSLRSVLDLVQKLNPKPGEGNITYYELNQITPDFIIDKDGENYIITLNDKSLPAITINKSYLDMLDQNKGKRKIPEQQKNAYKFLKEKFESAKWFINCIEQRRETLLKVMRAIFERQHLFFENGPKVLKPMVYKDVAEDISMDISTVSRVVNGKFVQSPMGIHELKYFFSEGLSTDSGEEVSNKHIKERIKEIILSENKDNPYSDDKIAEMLQAEGIHVARRTVAKYRESLKIPIARLRKEFLSLQRN